MAEGVDNLIGKDVAGGIPVEVGTPFYSEPFMVDKLLIIGSLSIHLITTGGGTLDVDVEQSNNYDDDTGEGSFVKSSEAESTIKTGFPAGEDLVGIIISPCKAYRFKFTAIGSTVDTVNAFHRAQ